MARLRLTDKGVLALRPETKDRVIWDEVAPGMGVRVRPSAHKSYVFRGRLNGKDIGRLDIGEVGSITLAVARETSQKWASLLKAGKHPAIERDREMAEARRLADRGVRRSLQEIEAAASRVQSPTSATKSANRDLSRHSKWRLTRSPRRRVRGVTLERPKALHWQT
jgi:hypothetical protein